MKKLHFDCAAGVSGDMTVGAFLDLGVPFSRIEEGLALLGISDEFTVSHHRVTKGGLAATKFEVACREPHGQEHHAHGAQAHTNLHGAQAHGHHHGHRHGRSMADIRRLIGDSGLPEPVKRTSLGIFSVVAEAEAKVHGVAVDEVHFHEVGAVDSIVDIVSAAICIAEIQPDAVSCSPLTEGSGTVVCQHGTLSVPVPAVLEIARAHAVPLVFSKETCELVTPTGIAICAYLADSFGPPSGTMTVSRVGMGAGTRSLSARPNVLRLILGEEAGAAESDCIIIETNIDDMTGEMFGYALEKLLSAGALDAFYTPIYMKKNRPACQLSVICAPERADALERLIFQETTSIGVRRRRAERTVMERERVVVETPYGAIAAKRSRYGGVEKTAPEYESVRQAAERAGAPFPEVYRSALGNGGMDR